LRKSKPFFVLLSRYVMGVTEGRFPAFDRVDLGLCP
jgi:hypothetical protein